MVGGRGDRLGRPPRAANTRGLREVPAARTRRPALRFFAISYPPSDLSRNDVVTGRLQKPLDGYNEYGERSEHSCDEPLPLVQHRLHRHGGQAVDIAGAAGAPATIIPCSFGSRSSCVRTMTLA